MLHKVDESQIYASENFRLSRVAGISSIHLVRSRQLCTLLNPQHVRFFKPVSNNFSRMFHCEHRVVLIVLSYFVCGLGLQSTIFALWDSNFKMAARDWLKLLHAFVGIFLFIHWFKNWFLATNDLQDHIILFNILFSNALAGFLFVCIFVLVGFRNERSLWNFIVLVKILSVSFTNLRFCVWKSCFSIFS